MKLEREVERLAELNAKLIDLLRYAVDKADEWHDDSWGGTPLSQRDPKLADARCVLHCYEEAQRQAFLETR